MMHTLQSFLTHERHANRLSIFVGMMCFFILCTLIPAQGLTDDDDFYAPAGISYFGWLQDLVTQPAAALQQTHIDKAFRLNKEHPPVAKWSIGFFEWLLHQKLNLMARLDAARAGVSFLAALMAAFVFRLLLSVGGLSIALFGALALFSLPRFLFHSQVATLDVPVSAMIVLTAIAFYWSLSTRRWMWGVGLLFGLALGTKLNAPFMAIGFVIYWALARWQDFRLTNNKSHLRLPSMPHAFWSMALIGPLVFFVTWPHLWHDTLTRLGKYIAFHMNHYPILLFYQGTLHLEPYAPWHMPFMMAMGTIPLPLLCIGFFGIFCALKSFVKIIKNDVESTTHVDHLRLLLLVQMVIAIGIVAFSNVPKYGGEKLFMPFFPLFCLIAALGLVSCFETLKTFQGKWANRLSSPLGQLLLILLVLGPGFLNSYHFHGGYALSYYSEVLGGLRGATAQGTNGPITTLQINRSRSGWIRTFQKITAFILNPITKNTNARTVGLKKTAIFHLDSNSRPNGIKRSTSC